jgi:hypothetical protein
MRHTEHPEEHWETSNNRIWKPGVLPSHHAAAGMVPVRGHVIR